MRSVDEIKNITGITSFSLAYVVDPAHGGRGVQKPVNWSSSFSPHTETAVLTVDQSDFRDGTTIVVWLQANDLTGGGQSVQLMVYIGRTMANVTSANFKPNPDDKYNSR